MHGSLVEKNKPDALAVLAAGHSHLTLRTETPASQFDDRVPDLQGGDCIRRQSRLSPWLPYT